MGRRTYMPIPAHPQTIEEMTTWVTNELNRISDALAQDTVVVSAPAPKVGPGQVGIGSGTATTVGAAGGASALPATPLGYRIENIGGTQVKVPYYRN